MLHLTLKNFYLQRDKKKMCHGWNMRFSQGDLIGIIGQNGVGKSTFLQSLAGFAPAYEGEVFLNDVALHDLSRQERAKSIGLLLQQSQPSFPLAVKETVAQGFFPHQTHWPWQHRSRLQAIRVDEALNQFDLASLASRAITTLSGGEQRRVDLATLCVQQPKIYLLDEPYNHLDLRHQYTLETCLKAWTQAGHIVLFSSHDIARIKHICSHVLLMAGEGNGIFGTVESCLIEPLLSRVLNCSVRL